MKTLPYVKVEYQEALNAKKEILSSQLEVLNILKKIQIYKELRKKELIRKNKLRILIEELNKGMKNLVLELPETEDTSQIIEAEARTINKSIDVELKEIEEKLAQLNQQ